MTTVVIIAVAIPLQAQYGIATNVEEVVNMTVNGEAENEIESLVTASGPLSIMTDVGTKIVARTVAESVSHHSLNPILLDPVVFSISPLLFVSVPSIPPLGWTEVIGP